MGSNPHYDYGLLWRAIVISLLLHVVLLLQPGLSTMSSHPAAGKSMNALLRPKTESPPQGLARSVRPSQTEHMPAATREVSAAATPAIMSAAPSPQTAAESTNGANVLGEKLNASNNGNNTASSAAAAPGNAELDAAEAQKSYVFAIAAEARRVKKYPPRALAAGWTGTAEIRVMVMAGGNVQAPQLHKSSGYADFDNAALSFVGTALERTPVPSILRARNFAFVLPVSFSINDE